MGGSRPAPTRRGSRGRVHLRRPSRPHQFNLSLARSTQRHGTVNHYAHDHVTAPVPMFVIAGLGSIGSLDPIRCLTPAVAESTGAAVPIRSPDPFPPSASPCRIVHLHRPFSSASVPPPCSSLLPRPFTCRGHGSSHADHSRIRGLRAPARSSAPPRPTPLSRRSATRVIAHSRVSMAFASILSNRFVWVSRNSNSIGRKKNDFSKLASFAPATRLHHPIAPRSWVARAVFIDTMEGQNSVLPDAWSADAKQKQLRRLDFSLQVPGTDPHGSAHERHRRSGAPLPREVSLAPESAPLEANASNQGTRPDDGSSTRARCSGPAAAATHSPSCTPAGTMHPR